MSDNRIPVWRLIAHHLASEEAVRWFEQTNRIAIGWGLVGDLRSATYASASEISEAIRDAYQAAGLPLTNYGNGGIGLYNVYFHMKVGDLVIVNANRPRPRVLVMEVQGDYCYKPELEPPPIGDYQHQRKATRLPINPDELWYEAGSGPRDGHSIRWTLIECRLPIDAATKERLMTNRSDKGHRR